jgi:hypothetical protein
MDENTKKILSDSTKIISKLQLLSAFFGDENVYKIYLRTQVIHALFETNPDLDITKLELFHLQFTDSVIDLLKKIKTSNEKNEGLLYDEIQLNRDLIDKLSGSGNTEQDFALDKQRQSLKMSLSLRKLYEVLSDDSAEYPLSRNINAFSARYCEDFFFDISPEVFGALIQYNASEVYTNPNATIQKKLMGQLCKYDFKTAYFYGLKAGASVLEVYKFADGEKYFLFSPVGNLFLFCDLSKITGVDWSNTLSQKAKIVRELTDKNNKLTAAVGAAKTFMPTGIRDLLAESYKKIADINFLKSSDFEIQANILKTMLNTDTI